MTREEAHRILSNGLVNAPSEHEWVIAFEIAIKALEEPCEDAISRRAVLEIQTKYVEHIGATKFWQMRDDIKALPPVTPKLKTGQWISVSERLPEEFESVLVCYESKGGMTQAVSERFGTYTGYRWSALAGIEPIAWMPLPEPYKAESDGKE